MTVVEEHNTNPVAKWSVGGIFLEALANRDFDQLAATLRSNVRFRALLPPGPMEWQGPEAVAETFHSWFGEAREFELVDATVGEVGGRLHLSWRLRVRPAPFGIGDGWHVIEQHAYAEADAAISALDLLCSGFNAERAPTSSSREPS
jgi:SnoaL-like domain